MRQREAEGIVINEQHPREPKRLLVGAATWSSFRGGSSTKLLVHLVGQLSNPQEPLRDVLGWVSGGHLAATAGRGARTAE